MTGNGHTDGKAKADKVLLLACYELGHQPLSIAWPLAALRGDGFEVAAQDLSLEALDEALVTGASLVGIAVPMHTALRLGVTIARRVRALNPAAHICFYGLYAWINGDYLLHEAHLADSVIAGEVEDVLRRLVAALAAGEPAASVAGVTTATVQGAPVLERLALPVPDRSGLPPLERYAHYMHNGQAKPAGYVEASRGCLHTCRHCPVVPVYGGRFFVVPVETVLADVRQQVAAGAGHITFGDPDFLNGPGHALRVAEALHAEFPYVTFDFTTKVEHLLERQALLPRLRELGASFVVSAFEATSDRVLAELQKGHTVADMDRALAILDEAGLPVQPTWVPFTPWTTLADYVHMLGWIRSRGLIAHVPPVQLCIRLLIPPHSALLDGGPPSSWLGALDSGNFTYTWTHPDPRMDALQQEVAAMVELAGEASSTHTFRAVEELAAGLAGMPAPTWSPPRIPDLPPPRLTEDWFC
ncbi:MAG: CUAEP/CCAEP-tail radical SAM protein [Anaerolineae bacterium]|nr:CUAEP/CCAEP-tail radical SAM protein [Anaerolineae bacterium]